VHRLTPQTHAPCIADWKLGKSILRYLIGTAAFCLRQKSDGVLKDLQFSAYSDADFAADVADRKSVSAILVYLNGMLITWVCSKQDNLSLSTMESEFVAAARAAQEIMGCIELAHEIGCVVDSPALLCMDNQAAIAQVESEASSYKSKHVDIKHKFIKDLYRKKIIKPTYVPAVDMKADLLTKAMPAPTFKNLRAMIGLEPFVAPISARRGGVLEDAHLVGTTRL
jgi:hypothetical protein